VGAKNLVRRQYQCRVKKKVNITKQNKGRWHLQKDSKNYYIQKGERICRLIKMGVRGRLGMGPKGDGGRRIRGAE